MAYAKTNWQTGDTIDATKLNHAEDGIAQAQQTADTANARDTLGEMTDVSLSSPTNGQVLTYDSISSKWKNASASGGASALSELTDVALNYPVTGQTLTYNYGSRKWVNSSINKTELVTDASGILVYTSNMQSVDPENYIFAMAQQGLLVLIEYLPDDKSKYIPITEIINNGDDTFTFKFGTISYTSNTIDYQLHRDT